MDILQPEPAGFPPAGSCDCHVHVIGPKARFPFAPLRSYTPTDAPVDALKNMLASLGLERAVVIQPSIYGTDNRCTLDALVALKGRARGVVVVDETVTRAEIAALDGLGVRGIRLNLMSTGARAENVIGSAAPRLAALCAEVGWHLQIFIDAAGMMRHTDALTALPVPVVLDHLALVPPGEAGRPALQALLGLVENGRTWVKVSGFYRVAAASFDPALADLVRTVVGAATERVVWGSDWPHTPAHSGTQQPEPDDGETPFRQIDTRRLLTEIPVWLDNAACRRMLVENPAELYGFPAVLPDR